MTYRPPDSVVIDRIKRSFGPDELTELSDTMNLVERERKLDIVALFYTLTLGFSTSSDRSIQAFLERYVAMGDEDELSYSAFHDWFTPGFVAFLRTLLDDAIDDLGPGRNELRGRLERFRDVLIIDCTFLTLYQDAADVYAGLRDDHAGAKLHVTESLSSGLPQRVQTTDATTHERRKIAPGEWVAENLILFDLGFYDFWLFDRIDANDGWFVSRVKSDANFRIVEELRTWPGTPIPLEGKHLQDVLDDLQRQEIDVRVDVSFERNKHGGSHSTATRTFRLVGTLDADTDEYHCYLTNLSAETYSGADIAHLYRARWEVELLFKELKSRFRLDEIETTDQYIVKALILMAVLSLLISRVIVDELHKLEAKRHDTDADDAVEAALPRGRCSTVIERHDGLIHLYLMLDRGMRRRTWTRCCCGRHEIQTRIETGCVSR